MPNSDYSTFTYTDVPDIQSDPAAMYTQKRVNQFVTDYKKFKENGSSPAGSPGTSDNYSYYHFVASPRGITAVNLGSIKSSLLLDDSTTLLWQPYRGPDSKEFNTPLGHQMNLMKEYSAKLGTIGDNAAQKISPTSSYPNKSIGLDDAFVKTLQSNNPSNFDSFVDMFDTNMNQDLTTSRSYGVEVFVYMKLEFGRYNLTFDMPAEGNSMSTFLIWIGDVAVCEYYALNTSMDVLKKEYVLKISDVYKVPIRIQYFATLSGTTSRRKTSGDVLTMLTITNADKSSITPMYFTTKPNESPFLYPILYAAFTSVTEAGYYQGKFQCWTNYTIMENKNKLRDFYDRIKKNKRDIFSGVHDRDSDQIQQMSYLPKLRLTNKNDPVYFSQNNFENVVNAPNVFSLYRLSVDSRYDKTYQISSAGDKNIMTPMDNTLFDLGDTFTTFTGYFPDGSTNSETVNSTNECRERCKNSPGCGYYYTFTKNGGGTNMCRVGSMDTSPVYNQVRPDGTDGGEIDIGSGYLYLRDKKLKSSDCPLNDNRMLPKVINTHQYTSDFKYSDYKVSTSRLTRADQIGKCGSSEFEKYKNSAHDILNVLHEYREDGAWLHNGNFSDTENFATNSTAAVLDASAAIQSTLARHDQLGQRLKGIDSQDQKLQSSIGNYKQLSQTMSADDRYDQKGNMLTYLNGSPAPPSLSQLNAIDSEFLSNQQTILFYTGIITAACLIVLAVTMGSAE